MTDKEFHVGELADQMPDPTQYEPSPFKKGRPPEPLQFEINLTAEAHDRQKKSGMVQVNIPGFSPVKLYCDEQIPVGDDTAPPPLAFLCAGINRQQGFARWCGGRVGHSYCSRYLRTR